MDTSEHTLNTFFQQLGLPDTTPEIDHFIATHQLPAHTLLARASFWTPAQAAFIREALLQDSDWSQVADKLSARLTAVIEHP